MKTPAGLHSVTHKKFRIKLWFAAVNFSVNAVIFLAVTQTVNLRRLSGIQRDRKPGVTGGAARLGGLTVCLRQLSLSAAAKGNKDNHNKHLLIWVRALEGTSTAKLESATFSCIGASIPTHRPLPLAKAFESC